MAPLRALKPASSDDDPLDTAEVPAAVVCARCGKPDCVGCDSVEESSLPSGVVAIVPWERPVGSTWSRLWLTTRAATQGASTFFGSMPPGELAAPLRYAMISEFAAVACWAVMLFAACAAVLPSYLLELLLDTRGRGLLLRLVLFGVPAFSLLLLGGKLMWGVALDHGARRSGARPHLSQAMRFGLYTAGWDLMLTPLGLVHLLSMQGWGAALRAIPQSIVAPSTATRALLRKVYHLEERQMSSVRRFATVVVSVISVVGVLIVLGLLVAAMIA